MIKLDRPIFLVGHARGGSTLLGAMINWHSFVGPKHPSMDEFLSINDFLKKLLEPEFHYQYALSLERKDVWFDFFPGRNVFSTIGREIIIERSGLSEEGRNELIHRLTDLFTDKRFFSKSPTNSFRIKVLQEIFPDAKIIALYRSGPEVVSSYINWSGRDTYRRLGYRKAIVTLSRKWLETIEYVEATRKDNKFLALTYDNLIENPSETLVEIFNYCELPIENFSYDLCLTDQRSKWKDKLKFPWRQYLERQTQSGMNLYQNVRNEFAEKIFRNLKNEK